MQEAYDRPVCDERFPCEAFRDGTAKRAIAESNFLLELTGCEGWQVARDAWRLRAQWLRYKLRDPKVDDTALRDYQAELKVYDLFEQMAEDGIRLGHDAQRWQLKRAEERAAGNEVAQRQKKTFGDPDALAATNAAQGALRRANVVAELVDKPGWKVLVRKALAMAWAHDTLLQDCAPEEGARHRAAMKALMAPIHVLQEALYLGCDAEEWFIQQEPKKEQE